MAFLKKWLKKDKADGYRVFFTCNGCFEPIEDGSKRYNCVDCVRSYDLCEKCHSCGKAEHHTGEMGLHHTFVVETQSHIFTSTLVHKADSLELLVRNMFRFYASRPAVGQYDRDSKSFSYLSFSEVHNLVNWFGAGLMKLMLERGCGQQSMVSMCSVPRLEWYLTDLACLLLSIPTVPLGANSGRDQMRYILNKAESSIVVCSLSILNKELAKVLPECPKLQILVIMDAALTSSEEERVGEVDIPDSISVVRFTEVVALGKKHPFDLTKIKHKPSTIYTVQFTSGSTGNPKGCVFNRNTWKSRISKGTILGRLNVWLSFHPPAHNLERGSFFITLLNGGKIGIYRGSMEHLLDDFALVRPTIVASTPRLWSMLYNQYLQELHAAYVKWQGQQQQQQQRDANVATSNSPGGDGASGANDQASDLKASAMARKSLEEAPTTDVTTDAEHFDVEKVPADLRREVMGRFKGKLGGREQMITTGGAPTGKMVKRFIIDCFEGMVNEGYGATEVGGIASDGSVLPTSSVKLVDVPEMGYFTTDVPPRGEICVKTPSMIDGYFKSPDVTADKFVDGYFLTGDIGVLEGGDDGGRVRIIDRKKNIFKLAQGEFVSPERLEALYVEASRHINQMYVYGNSLQSNVTAVVVPEEEGILEIRSLLCEESNDFTELCQSPAVQEEVLKEMQAVAREHSLPGWEVPTAILLEPSPFTKETGLLTSTLKKNRPKLEQKYKDILEDIYRKSSNSGAERPLEVVVFEWIREEIQGDSVHPSSSGSKSNFDRDKAQKSFGQLGGDSLSAMHLSALLKEHLSIDLPVDAILGNPLASLASNLQTHTTPAIATAAASVAVGSPDWAEEISLDWLESDTMLLSECSPRGGVSEMAEVVFLTGCTGFLGRFLLWELLQDARITKLFCLVQSKKGKGAEERVMEILQQLQEEFECDSIAGLDKLVVMRGNLSEPHLALAEDDYATLCENVDTIIHNGATVNSVLPYLVLKECNVESTKEIIRMAITAKPKFLHYVSTIGVFSPSQSQADESVKPSVQWLEKLSGYSQSKWVAESLVLSSIAQGKLKGNISRPGLIGPHKQTGHANLQDWVYWLVKGLLRLGLAPVGMGCQQKHLHWVPVDQVAKAVALTSLERRGWTSDEKANIFHLVNSRTPTSFNKLVELLALTHPTMKTTNYRDFRDKLSRQCREHNDQVLGYLDLLLPKEGGWPTSPLFYSDTSKVAMLENADIHLGLLHDRYVESYLRYIM